MLSLLATASSLALLLAGPALTAAQATATAAVQTPSAPSGPRIRLSADKLDFGSVPPGTSLSGELALENVGDQPLHVTRVGVTCECAKLRLSTATELNVPIEKVDDGKTDLTLAPGEKATLHINIDTAKLQTGQKWEKRCMIFCSDATKSPLSVPFSVTIEKPVVAAPAPPPVVPLEPGEVDDSIPLDPKADARRRAAREGREPPEDDDHRPAPTPMLSNGPPPRIECDDYKASFGEVYRGEKLNHTFTLKNTGAGELMIQEVRNSCSCSAAKLRIGDKEWSAEEIKKAKMLGTLKPGEECFLDVELRTASATMPGRDMPLSKMIRVYTNDQTRYPLLLTLEATMVTPFTCTPERFDFGKVKHGKEATASVDITGDRLGDFKILSSKSPNDEIFKVTCSKLPGADEAVPVWHVQATLLGSAPLGTYTNRLDLETDHDRVREISLTMIAEVVANLSFTCNGKDAVDRIDFGVLTGEEDAVRELVIENGDPTIPWIPKAVTIDGKPKSDAFKAELVEVEKGMKYMVRITASKSLKASRVFTGWIEITADHPDLPFKKVDFRGWFQREKK